VRAPFFIHVGELDYGQSCDNCHRISNTMAIDFVHRVGSEERVLRRSLLCHNCIESGIEIDLNMEVAADPEKARESRERIKTSRRLERVLADDLGGRPQPGSGGTRLPGYKGDVRVFGRWRLEHKYTRSLKSYILHLFDLAKIVGLATEANERPALIVEFERAREAFAVIPYSLFKELVNGPENNS
jgi:hypothetical protein